MSQLQITCPSCKKTFSADTALQNHLKAKEAVFQEETKTKVKLIEAKYKLEFQQKEKNIEKNVSKKVEEQNKVKLKSLQSQIQNIEKSKVDLEAKFNFDLKKKEKALEAKLIEKEKMLEKKLKNKNEGELVKLSKMLLEKDKELLAKDKEAEIFKRRQQKRLDEMEKQLKQKSVEVQGEVQEELIQDFLRNKFPEDNVNEIKKGANGADCILSINHKDKQNISQIYFESKDSKAFKEEWVSKLLKDMKEKNIDYGILVTTALPKNSCKLEGHFERHGKRIMIVPMEYKIIHTLVSSIRNNLIDKFKSKVDFDVPKEMKRLWDHITGPSFQLPVRNLYQTIHKMNGFIEKEKNFFEKSMANKERTMQDMDEEFKDMINSFVHKVGNEVLPETLLQITNNKEEK